MTGKVQSASVVQPRWNEGKNERIEPVDWPDCFTMLSTWES